MSGLSGEMEVVMRTLHRRRFALLGLIAALAALALVSGALAAEVKSGDIYRLEAGQVVEDDLIVSGNEIYIDGTVKGDLVAVGSYVEVNGTIEGDLMAAAAEVRINGTVTDDVRAAGAGVIVTGKIGDDLFAAAGGGEGSAAFSSIGGRQVHQGLEIGRDAVIGGGAYLGAGAARVDGSVAEDLNAGAGTLSLAGTVGGDANLDVSALTVADGARVEGMLTYSTASEGSIPAQAAGQVRYEPPPPAQPTDPGPGLVGGLVRLLLTLAGFALVGWLIVRFAPRLVRAPAQALAARPGQAGLYGLLAAVLLFIIPILSGLVLIAILVFWGWLPALMFFLFLTAALVLAWTLSPLVTGLWLGRWLLEATGRTGGDFLALAVGATLIVLLGFVPWVGWLVYLASFLLALGGAVLSRRGAFDAPAPVAPAAAVV